MTQKRKQRIFHQAAFQYASEMRGSVAAKNRRACAAARSRFNRDSARLKRWTRDFPPNRWFPVDLAERVIFDAPRRMRWQALAAAGVAIDRSNWRFARRLVTGGPVVALRGSQLRDERYRGFQLKEL